MKILLGAAAKPRLVAASAVSFAARRPVRRGSGQTDTPIRARPASVLPRVALHPPLLARAALNAVGATVASADVRAAT